MLSHLNNMHEQIKQRHWCKQRHAELSMGPFYVTQSNPAHRMADPTQLKFKNLDPTQPNPTQWNDGAVL